MPKGIPRVQRRPKTTSDLGGHTIGPWAVLEKGDFLDIYESTPIPTGCVARLLARVFLHARMREVQKANARVMAAAPELLELCQRFRAMYGSLWEVVDSAGCGHLSPESVQKYDDIHDAMVAAISKATGSQP